MRTEQLTKCFTSSVTEGEATSPVIHCKLTKAVVLLWFSVACFLCQGFGDVSPYVCSYHFSSVWFGEWPPFGKELLIRLTICSLCILTIIILVISRFGFERWIWGLIASFPCFCILFTSRAKLSLLLKNHSMFDEF